MERMTRDEYEQWWAVRYGKTVAELHSRGEFSIPCACGEAGCHGWQIMTVDEIESMKDLCRILLAERRRHDQDHAVGGCDGPDTDRMH